MDVKFFKSAAELRRWFERNHDKATEIWIGYYKKGTNKPTVTYAEAVEQALCFGWIDGVVRSVDEVSYANRYTPRRPGSVWSALNVKRIQELTKAGLMHPAGLKAFRERDPARTRQYSFEQKNPLLEPRYEKEFRKSKAAWKFFSEQAPSYQRNASWWVMSAKKEETRARRLGTLIEDSLNGRRIAQLQPLPRRKS